MLLSDWKKKFTIFPTVTVLMCALEGPWGPALLNLIIKGRGGNEVQDYRGDNHCKCINAWLSLACQSTLREAETHTDFI